MKVDVPPFDTKGRGCPVTGMAPTETAMFTMAWTTNINANPITR